MRRISAIAIAAVLSTAALALHARTHSHSRALTTAAITAGSTCCTAPPVCPPADPNCLGTEPTGK